MKRLSQHRRKLLRKRAHRQMRRTFARRVSRLQELRQLQYQQRRHRRLSTVVARAPKTILARVDDERALLLKFVDRVSRSLARGSFVVLDFSETENFHACGTLMLLANLDIWTSKYPGKLKGTYPANERSEELLQHMGVLGVLGLQSRLSIKHANVKFWHYHKGSRADAGAYRPLTQEVLDSIVHPQGVLFGDCLNEAVTNTVNHAYGFERRGLPDPALRKWWMLAEVKDDMVFVAIFDMGVTIPASLRRKPEWADFLKLRRWKDARLIEAAASMGRTTTGLPHRGKGLPEMVEFSKKLASGGLSISSGMGSYMYHADTNSFGRHRFSCPMPGTLVLWQIPFREELNHENEDDLNR